MEITGLYDMYQRYAAGVTAHATQKTGENAPTEAGKGSGAADVDTVNISSRATFQSKLDAQVKQYAARAKETAEPSAQRLAALKARYQGDSCPVSGGDVARAVLDKVCGPNGAEGEQA